ncbi:glycoside hydrolase family 43 protein [Curtobacterium sp. VKM Ac-2922]|uniref:glycoside hydrolase family 43 protein n=1 Tax=Curtobacterium sp. VKM Ac-2922 TaxID=2929475 RepID=UPI001FB42C75|nr:glycoside hydrolase family 43 protein [Curtobacterium sp. VKM Ac-2922]MCJ1714358.1 glycoside hydrolase family 43 protein [Curtobacterium sp. VKM Ac-2922]
MGIRRTRRWTIAAGAVAAALLVAGLGTAPVHAADTGTFHPGQQWNDDNGAPVQGHGGQVVTAQDSAGRTIYYWYGEDRVNGYANTRGVHVYSSYDLTSWRDQGLALRTMTSRADFDDPYFSTLYGGYDSTRQDAVYRDLGVTAPSATRPGAILERPKVIHNAATGQWVMWVHADGPTADSDAQYAKATAGVAVSDSPTGPFRYIDSYRLDRVSADDPTNQKPDSPGMARDMNLFVDDDGTAYIVYASEENLTLYISKLDADYTGLATDPTKAVEGVDFRRPQPWIGGQREAPALTKVDGTYYLVTSGATGWAPNAAAYATATDPMGTWTAHGNPATGAGADTTCNSQSTSLLNLGDGRVVYIGDRWNNAEDLRTAPSIWLPVTFGEGGAMSFSCDTTSWSLDDLRPSPIWTVTTTIPGQATLGDTRALPTKVTVREDGRQRSHRVRWAADALSTPGERVVTGTLDDGRTFTRTVTVMPKRLAYFVDAGGQGTSDLAADLRFAKQRGDRIINTVPDQRFGVDPGSRAHWGYFGTTGGTSGTSGGTVTSTVRWQADKTDLEYALGGLSKGKYRVDMGFWDPWTKSAPGRAAAVAVDGTTVATAQPIDGTYRTLSTSTKVGSDGLVDLRISPATGYGIQVSWIMVSRA